MWTTNALVYDLWLCDCWVDSFHYFSFSLIHNLMDEYVFVAVHDALKPSYIFCFEFIQMTIVDNGEI